jgi:CRP/FNR family transcriptional regulator, cyclic AMP receptor protein
MDTASFFDYPDGTNSSGPAEAGFLATATEADWSVIFDHAQTRRYEAGAQVAGADETDRALYLVLEGRLRVQTVPDERRIRRRTRAGTPVDYGPGSVLGERGFLEGRPFKTTVHALTSVHVLRLGLTEFEALAAKDPALGRYLLFDLARVLAARVEVLQDRDRPER